MRSSQIKSPILHDLQRESERRFNATRGAQLPEVVTFTVANLQQIMVSLHEDNPTISLAKQGLYEEDNRESMFHPDSKNWIGYNSPVLEEGAGSYKIHRKTVEEAIFLLGE